MSGVKDALARITADLSSTDVNFALIGGLAVSVRTAPRFTQDVDLAVAVPDDAAAEQTVKALMDRSYGLMATVEHDTAGRLATARLRLPASAQIVDLLFSSSGIEPEIVAAADMIYVAAGLRLPVAQVGHLLALKLLARDDERRPLDIADLRHLLEVADNRELQRAREAIALITERGYDRGRDLAAALDDLLRSGWA